MKFDLAYVWVTLITEDVFLSTISPKGAASLDRRRRSLLVTAVFVFYFSDLLLIISLNEAFYLILLLLDRLQLTSIIVRARWTHRRLPLLVQEV